MSHPNQPGKPARKPQPAAPSKGHSHEERLRHKGKMLDEIMAWKREELPARQAAMPLTSLRALAATAPDPVDFTAALRRPGVGLIAEIKQASPSRGLLCRDFDPARLARTYAEGGAAAISVLTDSRFFQGQLEHLTTVKETLAERKTDRPAHPKASQATTQITNLPPSQSTNLPILRKDFIYDPYQVIEARVAGADALLLIVAVLGDHDLKRLLDETRRHGMEALVEVHDEAEVERALAAGARVIGVNNRDLRTFAIDLQTTARLRPLIPSDRLLVAESGIHTPDDVRRLADMGVDGMLVGESLVAAKPEERLRKVRELVRAGSSRKATS
jgi:indole-3-glycerol phosphate synthase